MRRVLVAALGVAMVAVSAATAAAAVPSAYPEAGQGTSFLDHDARSRGLPEKAWY
jgi:hypothetical protein